MGTYRHDDCPHLMPGHSMCKHKMNAVMDRTDLTYNQKLSAMQISTCSGCEIYKNLKQCGKPQKNKKCLTAKGEKSMKNITITNHSEAQALGYRNNGNCKPVFCITTGEIYASATDAAEKLGVSLTVVAHAASGRIKTCKGKRYCYIQHIMQHLEEIAKNTQIREEKVAAYDKIVGKEKRKQELGARKAKLAAMKAKLEKEAALIAAEEAELGEV